jgi:hypothetical protein
LRYLQRRLGGSRQAYAGIATDTAPDHPRRWAGESRETIGVLRRPVGRSDLVKAQMLPAAAGAIAAVSPAAHASSTGVFLHLVSIALVAVATAGVFFGMAFSLLHKPASAMVEGRSVGGRVSNDGFGAPGSRPHGPVAAPGALHPVSAAATAAAPAAHAFTAPTRQLPVRSVAGMAPKAAPTASSEPAGKSPAARPLPDRQLAELLARGDVFLQAGDIASARLFYERAADAGDGQAALRVGATFDPTFLASIGLRNLPGDPAKAAFWYHRALGLGASGAEPHLNSLETK